MTRLTYILTAMLLLGCNEPETTPSEYNYNPFPKIKTNNADSLSMMLYCRGSKDSLLRVKIEYNLIK